MGKENSIGLKLNHKRTCLIGFAFFGILLLWQVYDSWCPTFLTDIFARNMYNMTSAELALDAEAKLNVQWLVGIIMACDNLAALILLPIFGSLSDRTKTPIGKRMPFILVGTFVSALAFPFIPLFFHYNNILGMVIMMAIVLIFMMMYRNPAVSLMPDITPKPLRARANGIINIIGYIGGACATVLGLFLVLSKYISMDDAARSTNLWIIELPFIIASVLMVISALVLFFTIKENKIAEEVKEDMEKGEEYAEVIDKVEEDKPLSKQNKIMLWCILIAEFLWFMADNAVGTYIGNYVIYYLQSPSSALTILTIAGGAASVVGFAIAGYIADKIGRKWTIAIGLGITVIAYLLMIFSGKNEPSAPGAIDAAVPVLLYVVWIIKGFGMSLVHNCSFPMIVELSTNKTIGKFTGFYYTASMSAQTITPVLLGLIFKISGVWNALPIYAVILVFLSFCVFTHFVRHVKNEKKNNLKGLEALGKDD